MQSVLLLVAIVLFIVGAIGVMLTRMQKLPGTFPIGGSVFMWFAVLGILLYLGVLYLMEPPPPTAALAALLTRS